MPKRKATRKLLWDATKNYILGIVGVYVILAILYWVMPPSWLVDIKSVQVIDGKYTLERVVRVNTLEARSSQELYCADGTFAGKRNTDWFIMANDESTVLKVPFNLDNFEPSHNTVRICNGSYRLEVHYFIRSNYFSNRSYGKKFVTDVFIAD